MGQALPCDRHTPHAGSQVMACPILEAFHGSRSAVLAALLSLCIAACSGGGASGFGSAPTSSASGLSAPSGGTATPASAPVISGTPATNVVAGQNYSFTPTALDPDGDALTFSIANKPDWATFDGSSGALMGTPAAANVGTYANIVISVSNGSASASLLAFSISVNEVSNGSAALTWTPVTRNTNGSTLTDLAGYRVHYGTSANAMNAVVVLANPSLTNYLVTNLSSGIWYFGITAYSRAGVESALSNVGHKTVP